MSEIVRSWIFGSDSNPSHSYETLQYADGSTSCNCRGWTFKREGQERQCKHTRMVEHGVADSHCQSVLDKTQTGARHPAVRDQIPKTKAKPVLTKIKTRKINW
jgi:hypothetical protein